jgi:hypothetical protein
MANADFDRYTGEFFLDLLAHGGHENLELAHPGEEEGARDPQAGFRGEGNAWSLFAVAQGRVDYS